MLATTLATAEEAESLDIFYLNIYKYTTLKTRIAKETKELPMTKGGTRIARKNKKWNKNFAQEKEFNINQTNHYKKKNIKHNQHEYYK